MNCQCTGQVPQMHVSKKDIQKRKKNHISFKHNALSSSIGKPETEAICSSLAQFENLLNLLFAKPITDSVRIYIGAFSSNEDEPHVPNGKSNTLTLIYTPCSYTNGIFVDDSSALYYLVTDYRDPVLITKKIAEDLVLEYRSNPNKLPLLNSIIQSAGYTGTEGDTKSVVHTKKELIDLLNEMKCQGAVELRAAFSSYMGNDRVKEEYKHRLFIEFNLVNQQNKIIYIEDCMNFNQRKPKEIDDTKLFFNNGALCPPEVCDGSSI